ncbi:nicotinate (nicotinamide) nucleotide adenylyltransferase [Salinimonas sp. HHU 13199]|uniref:Probable nicotinate-nucleotide adenylyltransferase n=1 Tax=Salinimonas profundi TaxID=2729140 RepID=A0ABR8LGI6_9ALTE|nr:nicotinate (nicotinamide) nucleotide adenylyltransferase [Salinimonas profundi]MBD3584648.1 nicotinate (nicotinamide) nucleotide adenylyltransferase [Salinimonas profundi]
MDASVICLLGGTFNPPHEGHVKAALDVACEIHAPSVGLMPCRMPPHKETEGVCEKHRVEMTRRATHNHPTLYTELAELALDEPSYTVKTLQHLRKENAQSSIIFVMGEDSWHSLTSWFNWQQLLDLAHIVVMRRQTTEKKLAPALVKIKSDHKICDPAKLYQQPAGFIYFAETQLQPISSSQLRAALRQSSSHSSWLDDWLHPSVLHYIRENRLYV